MNYDTSVRKRIKAEQKSIVVSNFKMILGMKLLFLLPFILLGILDVLSSWQQILPLLAGDFSSRSPVSSNWISLLQLVIGAPLTLGMMHFYITLMRGEQANISLLFHPFTSLRTFWRSLRMTLALVLRSVLWMIPPFIVVFIISIALFAPYVGNASSSFSHMAVPFIVMVLLYSIVFSLINVRLAYYNAGYVRLHDNEFIGCWDAQREAAQAFRGHYGDLLLFFLSFTPWYLAEIALGGLLLSPILLVGFNPSAASVMVIVPCLIAFSIAMIFFSAFLDSYVTMSFLRLFEHLAPAPEQPVETVPFNRLDSFEQNPYWRTSDESTATTEEPTSPQSPEEPAQPETTPSSDQPTDDSKDDPE